MRRVLELGISAARSLFATRTCLYRVSFIVNLDPASATCDADNAVNELVDGVNVTKIKGCDVPLLPHNAPYWSHSPYCPNWNYVKDFTQDLSAKRNTYLTLAGAFFMPIGAGFADKQGRKPILFFNFLMGMKSLLINLLSSTSTHAASRTPLTVFGDIVCAGPTSSCTACTVVLIESGQVASFLSAYLSLLASHRLCQFCCWAAVSKRSVANPC